MDPVVVVGGGLAGLAAALRLAKAGHPVRLLEASQTLGGSWAPYALADGTQVDDAPAVLSFPAPWRDLFRKSGRTLEAELARNGAELVPAAPARYVFADGAELVWPTDRGEQWSVVGSAYGEPVARRWRDLLDGLDEVWQLLRRLGWESELTRARLPRSLRQRLDARRSLASLATEMPHPHLTALLRSTAYRSGSVPERTPAWSATAWAVQRTFGRWRVAAPGDRDGRSSVLVEALVDRLRVRRVEVNPDTEVTALVGSAAGIEGVRTESPSGPLAARAAAVISTVDPWSLVALLPRGAAAPLRRDVRRLRPAAAPLVTHRLLPAPDGAGDGGISETVRLDAAGRPVVDYLRRAASGVLLSRHDFTRAQPRPAAGVAWHGFADWQRRPPVTTDLPGLYLAGPFSPAGNDPSAVLLSGALASYAVYERSAGDSSAGESSAPSSIRP